MANKEPAPAKRPANNASVHQLANTLLQILRNNEVEKLGAENESQKKELQELVQWKKHSKIEMEKVKRQNQQKSAELEKQQGVQRELKRENEQLKAEVERLKEFQKGVLGLTSQFQSSGV